MSYYLFAILLCMPPFSSFDTARAVSVAFSFDCFKTMGLVEEQPIKKKEKKKRNNK